MKRSADPLTGPLADALAEAGELVRDGAREELRARGIDATGELGQSLFVEVDGASVRIGAAAPHARFVEFGTRHQPARPFLSPALRGRRADVLAALRRHLARIALARLRLRHER